jgi:hypothetical protein
MQIMHRRQTFYNASRQPSFNHVTCFEHYLIAKELSNRHSQARTILFKSIDGLQVDRAAEQSSINFVLII